MLAGAQHCGSEVAGGHPPAKIAICAGTRLLVGVASASTNVFWPPVKIVFGLVLTDFIKYKNSANKTLLWLNEHI
jgi:hypothetical protein